LASAEAIRAGRRQYAGPVLIRTIRRSAASEPSGSTPGPSRPNDSPKATHDRAAGPVSIQTILRSVMQAIGQPPGKRRTIRRSDTRKPSGTPPGIRPSVHRSDTSELSGKPPGPPRTETICASRRASRQARLKPKRYAPAVGHAAEHESNRMPRRASRRSHRAVHRAIRRASRCRGAAYDPALKPPPPISNRTP